MPPLSRSDLLRALRPGTAQRPLVDAGLAGGLRAWLEDGVAAALGAGWAGGGAGDQGVEGAAAGAGAVPVVVDRWSMTSAGSGEDERGDLGGPRLTVAAARQAMVECLFRQLVTVGCVGRPFDDAVAGLRLTVRGAEVVAFVSSLPRAQRDLLRRDVTAHGRAMAAGWPALPSAWLPRTTARRSVPLSGGRVVLRATAPLALGAPAARRSSVCLVDVRAGGPNPEHGVDRRLLALAETLCAGAPPCRVATYYPSSSHVETEDPDDGTLAATVVAVLDALHRQVAVPPSAEVRA